MDRPPKLSDCARIPKAHKEKESFRLALSFLRLRLLPNIHQRRLFVQIFSMIFHGKFCVQGAEALTHQASDGLIANKGC